MNTLVGFNYTAINAFQSQRFFSITNTDGNVLIPNPWSLINNQSSKPSIHGDTNYGLVSEGPKEAACVTNTQKYTNVGCN